MTKKNVTLKVDKEMLDELRDRGICLSHLFEFAGKMFLTTEDDLK